ncbi:MAG: hypothetical protein OEV48_07530 [Acidobacteriota bacterium]|jgi:hypothetical protein|nr:hypothetical protein [Acidobacteriota bacterium]
MARLRVLGFVTAVFLAVAVAAAAQGYVVILKSGHKIRCKEPMRIEGPNAVLVLATGTLTSYPVLLVDLVETERYNQLGLGDALLIEELSVHGTPIPTPTPRTSLGQYATIDAGGEGGPALGNTVEPTPAPTPGIKLQTEKYHDERIDQAFSKIFDEKELLIYTTSRGTQPDHFFVQTTTDSEREVFDALETVAEAYVLINRIHPEISPAAVELKMVQTSGKPAGTFRLTPELAKELAGGETPAQTFYIKNVIF